MIRLARQTDYAARIVLHLASLEVDACVSISDLSRLRDLPVPFVRRIIAPLVEAGILETVRGKNGGLRLGRRPADISLLDIVRTMEGPILLNHCQEEAHSCPFSNGCPVESAWRSATKALEGSLESIRFDTLAQRAPGHSAAHKRLRLPQKAR